MPRPRTQHRQRPLIAFFGHADVFEDFYPHYGVSREDFLTHWDGSGNHRFIKLLQTNIGDALWYELSLESQTEERIHDTVGCRIRLIPSSFWHRVLWRTFYLSKRSWRWKRFYKVYATFASYLAPLSSSLIRSLLRERPDFLFAQDYATGRIDVLLVISRILGVPLVAYHAGSTADHFVGLFLRRFALPRVDWLIASSRREAQFLTRDFRVPESRVRVILTPVDLVTYRPFDRSQACNAAGLDPSTRYLLFVGRLEDRIKRVSLLIDSYAEVAARYPDTLLLIVGDGDDRAALHALAEQRCPSRVLFLGWVRAGTALANLYNAAECLCLPSRSEGFPNVVAEAMACGTPVVGSDVGGIAELVVQDQTGWLISPHEDEALPKAIDEVLNNPSRLATMRVSARLTAEQRVSTSAIIEQLRECFVPKERLHRKERSAN